MIAPLWRSHSPRALNPVPSRTVIIPPGDHPRLPRTGLHPHLRRWQAIGTNRNRHIDLNHLHDQLRRHRRLRHSRDRHPHDLRHAAVYPDNRPRRSVFERIHLFALLICASCSRQPTHFIRHRNRRSNNHPLTNPRELPTAPSKTDVTWHSWIVERDVPSRRSSIPSQLPTLPVSTI